MYVYACYVGPCFSEASQIGADSVLIRQSAQRLRMDSDNRERRGGKDACQVVEPLMTSKLNVAKAGNGVEILGIQNHKK